MAASFRVPRVLACLLSAVVAASIYCSSTIGKEARDDNNLMKLFEERAKVAEQAYFACQVAYEAGTINLESLIGATNELGDATLLLCKTKEERIAAREKHVERIGIVESKIKALNGVQAIGGEFDKLSRTGVQRVKAAIGLEQEKGGNTLAKLFEEREKLADHAYQDCAAAYNRGTIALDPLLATVDELAEAKLALSEGKEERLAVHAKQVERAKDIEANIRALNAVAARGGEDDKLARAALARVKAELAIEQEKRDRAPAKADDKLAILVEQRAELADQAYRLCADGYEKRTIELDTLLTAIDELADAKLALCKTKPDRIAVRKRHVERAKKHESAIRALSDRQERGGEADQVARAGVERVKAEIALELEKRDAAGETR